MRIIPESWNFREPRHSSISQRQEDSTPFDIYERYVALLQCDLTRCGEIVAALGELDHDLGYDEEGGQTFDRWMRPTCFSPPPPIIVVPKGVPRKTAQEVERAFGLYWFDLPAAANALRTSVEKLLDDFAIPRDRTNKKGGKAWLKLQERIDLFKTNAPEYVDSLDALRIVGNLGSHGTVKRNVLLDALEVYEEALAELYGRNRKRLREMAKKIIDSKGEY